MKKLVILGIGALISSTSLQAAYYGNSYNSRSEYYPRDSSYENYYGTERQYYPRNVYTEFSDGSECPSGRCGKRRNYQSSNQYYDQGYNNGQYSDQNYDQGYN